MMYQLSPTASKRNAFCWLTWQPQIDWGARSEQTRGFKQTAVIEEKRATGVDLLYLGGMGSAVRQDPRYPKDRALPQLRRAGS
jgi:hypothetical protein